VLRVGFVVTQSVDERTIGKPRPLYRRLQEARPVGACDLVFSANPQRGGRSERAWSRRGAKDFSAGLRQPVALLRRATRPKAAGKMPSLGHGRAAPAPP
jgi:hypothetical protein